MALQALIEYSTDSKADVDLTVSLNYGNKTQEIKVNAQNFDILQIVEIPVDENVTISTRGQGEAIGQIVRRFNMPEAVQESNDILKVDVTYNTDEVEVNDEIKVIG